MKKKPKLAPPVWPNAGVQAWYTRQLQGAIFDMSRDVLRAVREVWRNDPPISAMDSTVRAAGVMFTVGPDILLLHRTDGQGWAFPAGGVEASELPEAAARREASEETGWATGGELDLYDVTQWGALRFWTFRTELPDMIRPILNHEHDAFRWLSIKEALRLPDLHRGVRASLTPAHGRAQDAKDSTPALLRKALEKWGGLWTRRLDRLSLSLSRSFATRSKAATDAGVKASMKTAGFTVTFKPTAYVVQAYDAVVAENINLIKSIPAQYLKDVQSVVYEGVMRGGDLASVTDALKAKYAITYRRAAFIARDQNAKAKAAIEAARRKELGITHAVWMHSHAGKEPRPTHVAMDGKLYPVDKGLYDSDPRVKEFILPGQLINCRCVSKAVIEGFE